MNMTLSSSAKQVVTLGSNLALKMLHPNVGAEHILLALLQSPYIQRLLDHCQVDGGAFYEDVYKGAQRENVAVPGLNETSLVYDPSMHEVFNRASSVAGASRRTEVAMSDLLIAISRTTSRHWLASLLDLYTINHARLYDGVQALAVEIQEAPASVDANDVLTPSSATGLAPLLGQRKEPEELSKYAVCLTTLARTGKLTPVIGRDVEVQRVIQTLARHRKNNPLLVGEPGVGKTAIAEGLAQRIVNGEVPASLTGMRLFNLSLGALVAGTKYRGEFETRVKNILAEVSANRDIVLVIDEIHTLLGAGSASGGVMDGANLLKPALASGDVRVIGATTYDEYREVFAKDRALARRFQKIDVGEPSPEDARVMLLGIQGTLEKHHGIRFAAPAVDAALTLSIRHLTDRKLPDKAIDVLDEAGAFAKLGRLAEVTVETVETVVAQIARVPVGQVASSDRQRLLDLDAQLRAEIFGQDTAIATLVKAIKVARAGLRTGSRPLGSFLFAGPTGVGKTELTTQLAKKLGLPLLRFDMSEYQEEHSVSRLIGAPAGYVGHEEGGLLTEAVHRQPHAVVLLDEFEKAHPSIARTLLQVMDHGQLTDSQGRATDFRHVVLVLTTNVGAAVIERRTIGFHDAAPNKTAEVKENLRHSFPPEFRNRLDAVVHFQPLARAEIHRVVDKNVQELAELLRPKGIALSVSAPAREWLAEHGHDPAMGARPMRRLIEETLHIPLADAMLGGDLENGGEAHFDVREGQIVSHFQAPSLQPPRLAAPKTADA